MASRVATEHSPCERSVTHLGLAGCDSGQRLELALLPGLVSVALGGSLGYSGAGRTLPLAGQEGVSVGLTAGLLGEGGGHGCTFWSDGIPSQEQSWICSLVSVSFIAQAPFTVARMDAARRSATSMGTSAAYVLLRGLLSA